MRKPFLRGMSLVPFVFVILLLFLGFVAFRYYGSSAQSAGEISDASLMNMLRGEVESTKRFSKLSLAYASDQAIYEHSAGGGICSPNTANGWICNSPSPKDFEDSKKCLEKYTLNYLNRFVRNYTTDLPIDYELKNFTKIQYGVSLDGVMSGKYDEGDYVLYVNGSSIKISARNSKATEDIRLEEQINRNRYWYLYRKFYEWSNDNVFSHEVRNCTITCQGCECIEHAAESALESLKAKFDKYVDCKFERVCCMRGPSRMTGLLKGFSFWNQAECISACQMECRDPANANDGYGVDLTPFSAYTYSTNSDGISDNKLAAVYEFSCTDNKYFIATGAGPEAVTFKVLASASFVDNGAC